MQHDVSLIGIMMEASLVVKLVILLLVICSVASWGIVFYKKAQSSKVKKSNRRFLESFYTSSNLDQTLKESQNYLHSPFSVMFQSGYSEFESIQASLGNGSIKSYFQSTGLAPLERALKKGANISNRELDKLLSILASIGSISPFIGLFGTVWGIINSFAGLASGGSSIEAVAPGIAEALIVTAIGLATAIPAVWFYNSFNNENQKINNEMEAFGQDFLNLMERNVMTGS